MTLEQKIFGRRIHIADRVKNGTIKHSSEIDFSGDLFNRSHDPGYYVYFGMWKGPFPLFIQAKSAYEEWVLEAKHS